MSWAVSIGRPAMKASVVVAASLAALLGSGIATAAPAETPSAPGTAAGDGAASAAPAADWTPAGERELGMRLGLATGGRVTPGGVRMTGVMLYRVSENDWFEGSMGFTFGRRGDGCFIARDGAFTCTHGALDGAAADLMVGIRRFVAPREQFAPYLRAGVGLRLVRFPGDEVDGVAVPLVLGAGARARVSDRIAVGGDVALEAGAGLFDHALGVEPQLGLAVQATVELRLD